MVYGMEETHVYVILDIHWLYMTIYYIDYISKFVLLLLSIWDSKKEALPFHLL